MHMYFVFKGEKCVAVTTGHAHVFSFTTVFFKFPKFLDHY